MEYKQKNENEKMCFFAECKRDFETFLNFFWKIMLDICQEKIDSINKIYENLELIHHNQKWLEQIMKVHGINLQEIVILYVDGQQTIHFYLKNELKRDFI